jgi:flagellum-specific peptidoglycan hydrolase FlgJ
MLKKLFLSLLFLVSILFSLKAQEKGTPQQYIEKYREIAIKEMKRSGVPASITLSQGILESASGNSKLSRESNNHFGIKCKSNWTGRKVYADDDEKNECFRAYDNVELSYKDHSDFLRNNMRYAKLFDLEITDYKGWANGLKAAGYATNPKYGDILISVIEKYKLYEYDDPNAKPKPVVNPDGTVNQNSKSAKKNAKVYTKLNNIPVYIVKEGESVDNITNQLNLMRFEIRKYNELSKDDKPKAGTILYLKPKRNKPKEDTYKVENGDNLYFIAQKFGIKLKKLRRLNRLKKYQEPVPNQEIYLKKKRKNPPTYIVNKEFSNDRSGIIQQKSAISSKSEKETIPVTENKIEEKKEIKTPVTDKKPQSTIETKSEEQENSNTKENSTPTIEDGNFPTTHIVNPGETMSSIADLYKVSKESIMKMNGIKFTDEVVAGQVLFIPSKNLQPKSDAEINSGESESKIYKSHIVKKGETLYGISKQYNISVSELETINGLTTPSIREGQEILIPKNKTIPQNQEIYHVVEPKETLYGISKKYGVSIESIIENNQSLDLQNMGIKVGQKIKIQ